MKKEEKESTTAKKTTTTTTKKKDTPKKQTAKTTSTAKKATTSKQVNSTKTTTSTKAKEEIKSKKDTKKEEKESKKVEVAEKIEPIDEDIEEITENSSNDEQITKEKRKLKKSDLFLIVGLVIVVILGSFLMKGEKEEPSYQLPLTLEGEAGLHFLSYSDYQQKIDNKESFVVILSRKSCSHCANFIPVAKQFAEDKKLPMYYVDTDTFTEEDWNKFETSNTFLKKNSGNWGTPTTIVLAGNEAVDYIEGETTADKLQELYNNYFDMNQE